MPWLGIEPATFCFGEWSPTNWATPVRAAYNILMVLYLHGLGRRLQKGLWWPSADGRHLDSAPKRREGEGRWVRKEGTWNQKLQEVFKLSVYTKTKPTSWKTSSTSEIHNPGFPGFQKEPHVWGAHYCWSGEVTKLWMVLSFTNNMHSSIAYTWAVATKKHSEFHFHCTENRKNL